MKKSASNPPASPIPHEAPGDGATPVAAPGSLVAPSGPCRLSIRQLEAFRAFMLVRTTTGAADVLGISQPAVSRLIDQLEMALHFELFDRSNGRLVPTPEAGILFEEVERTFVSVDKISEIAQDIRSARTGSLTIAVLPALALGFMPAAIARFARQHPRTRISMMVQPSIKIEELTSAHNVDFGIGEFPFVRSGIQAENFCRTPYVVGVPTGSPLAKQSVVRAEDLRGVPFISLSANTAGRHIIDRVFFDAGVAREQVYDAQNSAVIAMMVAQGLGVGLIDPFTAKDFEGRGVETVSFMPEILFHVGILHPIHRPLSRVAREFLLLLRMMRHE